MAVQGIKWLSILSLRYQDGSASLREAEDNFVTDEEIRVRIKFM